ncbi:cytidine deaminase [Streptomyces goshikiensis]|nr:cytidine deaminase [Streptomyces goshikiensis]
MTAAAGWSRGRAEALPMLSPMTESTGIDPEDSKIITLARSARARNAVPEGAAVRDETGRTYVAGTVELDSLKLSALRTAVAMAVASGARSLEAAAVVSAAESVPDADRAAVRDLGGAATPVLLAAPDGTLRSTTPAGA